MEHLLAEGHVKRLVGKWESRRVPCLHSIAEASSAAVATCYFEHSIVYVDDDSLGPRREERAAKIPFVGFETALRM